MKWLTSPPPIFSSAEIVAFENYLRTCQLASLLKTSNYAQPHWFQDATPDCYILFIKDGCRWPFIRKVPLWNLQLCIYMAPALLFLESDVVARCRWQGKPALNHTWLYPLVLYYYNADLQVNPCCPLERMQIWNTSTLALLFRPEASRKEVHHQAFFALAGSMGITETLNRTCSWLGNALVVSYHGDLTR